MGIFSKMFGLKSDADYKGAKPMQSITETKMYKPTFEGQGGVYDAIKRRNTGFDERVMSDQESTWAKLANRAYGTASNAINARATAGGLGRSTVANAQRLNAANKLAENLANRSAGLRLSNEQNISQQQMQGRGIGMQGIGADVNAAANFANFERGTFDRQLQAKQALEQQGMGIAKMGLQGLQMGAGLWQAQQAAKAASAQQAVKNKLAQDVHQAKLEGLGGYGKSAPMSMYFGGGGGGAQIKTSAKTATGNKFQF